MELSEASNQLDKVKALISFELYHLHRVVGDWSYWDDSALFINDQNQAYIDENLSIETLENLNIDMMLYMDESHQLIHMTHYDFESRTQIENSEVAEKIIVFHEQGFEGEHQEYLGLLQFDGKLMLIASRYILPTDLSGLPLGHLIFVRIYDDAELELIEDIFGFKVNLVPIFELKQSDFEVQFINQNEMIVYGTLDTLDQDESLLLSLTLNRLDASIVQFLNQALYYSLALSAFILSLILFSVLKNHFTDRIELLVNTLKNYQNDTDFKLPTLLNSKDEIHELTHEISSFINQINRKNKHIYELAYIDPLTGLDNRNKLYDYLANKIDSIDSSKTLWLLHFDIDYFAHVNTHYGFEIGNLYIKKIASILETTIQDLGMVARLYADQFLISVEGISLEEVVLLAQQLIDKMNLDQDVGDFKISSHASIGIVQYSNFASTPDEMGQRAYEALVHAEKLGRNQFYVYDEQLNQKIQKHNKIFSHLKSAIKYNEFHLVYQPQIDMTTKKIIGFEALIRWVHPQMGFISPLEFIEIAESQGYINQIGQWVLNTACEEMSTLFKRIGQTLPFSVNVSGNQFKNGKILEQVDEALAMMNLSPELLELEITESTFINWGKDELFILEQLKSKGVVISMDDFGTGYSSLSQIHDMPCDIVKIDSKFIWGIGNQKTERILSHVLKLTKELGMTVIAEGVETDLHEAFLIKHHCRLAQGYYYYKPMKIDAIINLMEEIKKTDI